MKIAKLMSHSIDIGSVRMDLLILYYIRPREPLNISGLQASLTEPSRILLVLICIIIDTTGVVVANCSNIDR